MAHGGMAGFRLVRVSDLNHFDINNNSVVTGVYKKAKRRFRKLISNHAGAWLEGQAGSSRRLEPTKL